MKIKISTLNLKFLLPKIGKLMYLRKQTKISQRVFGTNLLMKLGKNGRNGSKVAKWKSK
jgi:hypothetical protein